MANHDHLDRRHNVLHHLTHLPRKIVSLNGAENLTEFVLHDLCQSRCFNLPKAAYFVNNPDFNCIKGVAGVHADELFQGDAISAQFPSLATKEVHSYAAALKLGFARVREQRFLRLDDVLAIQATLLQSGYR